MFNFGHLHPCKFATCKIFCQVDWIFSQILSYSFAIDFKNLPKWKKFAESSHTAIAIQLFDKLLWNLLKPLAFFIWLRDDWPKNISAACSKASSKYIGLLKTSKRPSFVFIPNGQRGEKAAVKRPRSLRRRRRRRRRRRWRRRRRLVNVKIL